MDKITATLVKQLRDQTGEGMGDCKKALVEKEGEMEKAIDYIKEKEKVKGEKRE